MPETDNPFADVLPRPDGETAPPPRPSRNRGPGTVTIAGHFSPAVHRQLRLLGVMQDRTVQSLLGEALNETLPQAREAPHRAGVGRVPGRSRTGPGALRPAPNPPPRPATKACAP